MDAHPIVARVLDRAQLQDPSPGGGHLEHLLEGDACQLARVRDYSWIGAEYTGNVGIDFAHLSADGGRERHRGCVRATAAERGDIAGGRRDALEAGDEHDPVLGQGGEDALGAHIDDARLGVRLVGHDSRLRARQRDGAVTEIVDRHRAQRAGDALSRGEQHVHLARVGSSGDLLGHRDQLVGRLAARGQNHHDAVAGLTLLDDARSGTLYPLSVGDRGTTELHYHDLGHVLRLQRAAPRKSLAQRDLVGVLQVRANRQSGGKPCDR